MAKLRTEGKLSSDEQIESEGHNVSSGTADTVPGAAKTDGDVGKTLRDNTTTMDDRQDRRLGVIKVGRIRDYTYFNSTLQRHLRDRETYATLLEFSAHNEPRSHFKEAALAAWHVDRHPKPIVSLLDGPACSPMLGLAVHGTHAVAGELFTFCTPDIRNSDTPHAGLSLILARLPGHLGLYLALSGRPIDRALAYRVGLVTHCVEASLFAEIRERLAEADPVDDVLDGLHRDPGRSPLDPYLPTIDACFAAPSAEDIVARLETVTGPEAAWAHALAEDVAGLSAATLDATFNMLTDNPPQTLRAALTLEYRVAMARAGLPGAELDLPPEPQAPSIF